MNCLAHKGARLKSSGVTRTFLSALLILGGGLWTLDGSCDVVLSFSTGQYGLNGDGPGDSSDLLLDTATGYSSRITTRSILPGGGVLNVVGGLGINAPYVDGDNLFDPGGVEAWGFSWDRDVVLNSLVFLRVKLGNVASNAPMVLSIRSDAWIGKGWVYTGQDPKRVYQFDSPSGAFTFTGYPTNTESQTTMTFSPADYFDSPLLSVPADATITILNQGTTYAGLRSMSFQIVPEPSAASLLIGGLFLFAHQKRVRNGNGSEQSISND